MASGRGRRRTEWARPSRHRLPSRSDVRNLIGADLAAFPDDWLPVLRPLPSQPSELDEWRDLFNVLAPLARWLGPQFRHGGITRPRHAAIDAAISIAVALDLPADDATVLQNSNKLALRLLPCDVFARVAPVGHEHAPFEVELAQRLAETESPVAALEPRVEPRGYERDGFEVTLWTYYEPATPEISPAAYADALERLHAGMRTLDVPTPHFTDRVARPSSSSRVVISRRSSPTRTGRCSPAHCDGCDE